MVTAHIREEIVDKAEEELFDCLLVKPVIPSILFNSIIDVFNEEGLNHADKSETSLQINLDCSILLVEDNEINQQVAAEILRGFGCQVEVTDNGQKAIDIIKEKQVNQFYDLILMDLHMPVLDGYEATGEIRKTYSFDQLPIISMTADAVSDVENRVLACGMNDYITKPIDPDELVLTIQKWIKTKSKKKITNLQRETRPTLKNSEILSEINIDGLNIHEGLKHLQGNEKLYIKLLNKFKTEHKEDISKLTSLYEEGLEEDAFRLVHTLKGVSGNLGAERLFSAAVVLEHAIKEGSSDLYNQSLNLFKKEFFIIMTGLEKVHFLEELSIKEETTEEKLGDSEFMDLMVELSDYIKNQQPRECSLVFEKLSAVKLSEDRSRCIDQLVTMVSKYKFREASIFLNSILSV